MVIPAMNFAQLQLLLQIHKVHMVPKALNYIVLFFNVETFCMITTAFIW